MVAHQPPAPAHAMEEAAVRTYETQDREDDHDENKRRENCQVLKRHCHDSIQMISDFCYGLVSQK